MTKNVQSGARRRMGPRRDVFVTTVLAGLIASAYAQAQSTTAAEEAAKQTVVVTGIRSSLALSANEKRDNIGLSDTVFQEDMGKFPEPNIADALARIPGVTVTRASIDGEGMNISIRGMGPAFTRVLLNSAPMASASAGSWGGVISANREVDMDFLPSELFRSASVYKSQQASLMEGGIAGTVNMRSVRPFDKSGFRSAFTFSGNYRDEAGKFGNTGSALVSNTWKSSTFGKFGALAGVAFGNTAYKTEGFQAVDMRNFQLKTTGAAIQALPSDNPNSTGGGSQSTPDLVPAGLPLSELPEYARSVLVAGKPIDRAMLLALNPGATIQQIDNALMARLGRHLVYEGKRNRVGETLSFQWQPNDKLDFYLDTVFAQKSNKMQFEAMNAGTRAGVPIPIGMEFDRSDCTYGCVLKKAILANTFWNLEFRPMLEKTTFRSYNPGFEFRPTEKLTIDGHFNKTDSDFYRDMPTVLLATKSAPSIINYDNTASGQPPVYTSNVNYNDPSQFGWYQSANSLTGVRMDLFERTNTTHGARLNVNWGDSDFSIKVGGSWDDIERRYRGYSAADSWQNLVCANNMNYRFFPSNTATQGVCDGRNAPGVMANAATLYPGFGTGSTAGVTTGLAYLGSVVPNNLVPNYASPSDHGFITLDWPKFAKDTDYQYFRDNIHRAFQNNSGGYIREVVEGTYVEVNGRANILGRTLRYNAGVRYAHTEQTIGNLTAVADPRNASLRQGGLYDVVGVWEYETTRYHNIMPSATFAYNITPKLIARASGSQSMTRANPADLKQTRVSINDQSVRTATATNPNLKAFQSKNLDLGLEYYMTRESYVALGVFAKDITDRPATLKTMVTLADLDARFGTVGLTSAQQTAVDGSGGRALQILELSEPVNVDSKLKVRGFELTWQQNLDMLPIKGFGLNANFTYTKQTDAAAGASPVSGVPPRTNNLTVYYERNGLSARVSRQYTATHIANTGTGLTVPGGAYAYNEARSQVDVSAGMDLKKVFNFRYNTNLNLSVWNLNNAIGRQYTQFADAVSDETKPGRSYTLSLRTSF